jgi:hypothetical protein
MYRQSLMCKLLLATGLLVVSGCAWHPPVAYYNACQGKNSGNFCTVSGRSGDVLTGTCTAEPTPDKGGSDSLFCLYNGGKVAQK